jgi:acylphosphatase
MEKIAYFVKISGRVTGVAFRYSALEKSKNLHSIAGYIRNSGYSEVETVVQGEKEEVDKMVSWLNVGPALARVDDFSMSECPYNPELNSFRIRS